MKKTQSTCKRGFTLIELLVVIAIIGLLAALAFPAFNKAMDSAHQATDISNVKQVGVTFFTYANDNDGNYPTTNTTAVDLFNSLTNGGYITTPSIVSSTGSTPMTPGSAFVAANIGWGCAEGLTTSDNSGLPLVWSTGTTMTVNGSSLVIDATTNYWGKKGKQFAAVYYLNGSAGSPKFNRTAANNYTATNALLGMPSTYTLTNLN